MPRVKKETKPVEKKVTTTSLRAPKGRGNLLPLEIAQSKTPRNDGERITGGLSIPVYSLSGRASGTLSLPKEYFGQKVNKKLLAQAVRVYMTNQKKHPGSTKTRGEVEGSTAKIYRQKGTGRARHGSIRAPIFVGGGIVFGPKPRKVKLDLSKKMRKAALVSALSSKALDKNIIGLSNLEKASGKTKEIAQLLTQLNSKFKTQNAKSASALIVTGDNMDNVIRAVSNIRGIDVLVVNMLNAYEVVRHEMLMVTKEAVENLGKQESSEEVKSQKEKVKKTSKNSKVKEVKKEEKS